MRTIMLYKRTNRHVNVKTLYEVLPVLDFVLFRHNNINPFIVESLSRLRSRLDESGFNARNVTM